MYDGSDSEDMLDLAVFAPYELVKSFGSIKLHTMSLVTGMYA